MSDADEPFPADELPPPPGTLVAPPGWGRPAARPPAPDGYDVGDEIGRGGMAVVYRARQRSLNRWVALKVLFTDPRAGPADAARVRAEAEAVARLQHPNVVHVYEVGERDGCPYLLMEYADGGTLADRLRGGPVAFAQAAGWAEAIARGVHAAHRRGIVHRDLKPANVLFTADGVPKIADFGIARRLDEAGAAATRTGVVVGTPAYMAPEQAEGRGKAAGPAADVWAVGAILYELLTGRPPFEGETAFATLRRVTTDPPVPPSRGRPGVPPALEAVCLKCLEKRPADRYPTAEALADDLARCRAGDAAGGGPRSSRRSVLAPAIGAGLILLVAVVAWRPWRADAPPAPAAVAPTPAGGPRWEQFRIAADDDGFQQIAFPTRDTGFAASRTAVYRTDDAGEHWRRTWGGKPGAVHVLTFEDAARGWLGAAQLVHTTDGGKTWNAVPLPGPETTAVRALALGPGGWGLAGGVRKDDAGFALFRRKPGGTWEALDPAAAKPYRDWFVGGLAAAGPRHAWLTLSSPAGVRGVVLHTADGGDTWEAGTKPFDTDLLRAHFADEQRGWLAGFDGRLWATGDGGRSWAEVAHPGGSGTARWLAFARTGGLGLAPLPAGGVLRTDDGRAWRVGQPTGLGDTAAAAVVDPGRAYVLGADGRVARWTDPRVPAP